MKLKYRGQEYQRQLIPIRAELKKVKSKYRGTEFTINQITIAPKHFKATSKFFTWRAIPYLKITRRVKEIFSRPSRNKSKKTDLKQVA